jgi:hypothetical protein
LPFLVLLSYRGNDAIDVTSIRKIAQKKTSAKHFNGLGVLHGVGKTCARLMRHFLNRFAKRARKAWHKPDEANAEIAEK